jgi:hopene-associated glycosyltransferase HpnB
MVAGLVGPAKGSVVFVVALIALAGWLYLLCLRGGFWRADQVLPARQQPAAYPPVAVIIPARNEEDSIGRVVAAHERSDYPGPLHLFVCDDGSEDATAARAEAAGGRRPLTNVDVPELPPGWSGKLNALQAGVDAADEALPDAGWLLFTDADIEADSDLLRKLVATGERDGLAFVSLMAQLDASGFWGRLLVPAFIYFFQKLYPFALVNRPSSPVAGAAGGVVLIRPEALRAAGGLHAMRGALIDDCTLAARVKETGEPIGLYLSSEFAGARSLRPNDRYGVLRDMVARSAFTQLRLSPLLLLGTLVGMALLYLAPPLILLTLPFHGQGGPALLSLIAWALMSFSYLPTLRRYGLGRRRALTLPLAAFFYGWFTWLSAWRHLRGGGARWKGRSYPSGGQA